MEASDACTISGEGALARGAARTSQLVCEDPCNEEFQAIAEGALTRRTHIGTPIDSPSCLDLEF